MNRIQLWGTGSLKVALPPVLLTQASVGLQWQVAMVVTHDGAKKAFDAVRNSHPGVFGGGLEAVVHPRLPLQQGVPQRGRLGY